MKSFPLSLAAILTLSGAALPLFAQGLLTPPLGPPAPVMKTLTQVEPRTPVQALSGIPGECQYMIDQPGAYYLTGNITGVAGETAIEVTTNSVTLDLNGFALTGVAGANFGVTQGGERLTVRNGTISDWPLHAILGQFKSLIAEDLILENNGEEGVYCGGDNNIVRRCLVDGNAFGGIGASGATLVEDCQVESNGGFGINLGAQGESIRHCIIRNNAGNGIDQLINHGSACLIENNVVTGNHSIGMNLNHDNRVTNNLVTGNGANDSTQGGPGIYLDGANNTVESNHLSGNKSGIKAALAGNEFVVRNFVAGSTSGAANNYLGTTGANFDSFGPVATSTSGANSAHPMVNISLP